MPDIFRDSLRRREETAELRPPAQPSTVAGKTQLDFTRRTKEDTPEDKTRKAKQLAALLRSREVAPQSQE